MKGKREKSRIYVFWPLIVVAYCNNAASADVYSAQIEPAELRKLPLHARRLCLVLGSACLRHSGPEYPCRVHRL
jgi:hypothetical protein